MTQPSEVWPPHAYVPGKTPRHAENTFDTIRDTAQAGLSPDQLAETSAFLAGMRYLEAGFYWEAHEVFEPVWMALPDPCAERQFVQGLIQIANGLLKIKMGKPKAAARLHDIASPLVSGREVMGVDPDKVRVLLESLRQKIEEEL